MNQNTIVPNIGQWKIKEEFNVLSEFDGMSCGQLALQMSGKKVTNYFASEIDKYAIQIANKNFPNTKQLGDVTKINISKLPKIHLFIGGSPCQGFSFAGKQLNFSDPRSKLFFEFAADLRFIQEFVNPDVKFFLENVIMKKEYEDVITRFMGVSPVKINSSLVSAQNRKRIYWTNIEGYNYPEDEGIMLKDIVHEYIDMPEFKISDKALSNKKYVNEHEIKGLRNKNGKSNCLTASMYKGFGNDGITVKLETLSEYIVPFDKTLQILDKEVQRGKVGYFKKDSQANRIYYIHDKAVTLCGDAGGGAAKMGQYLFGQATPLKDKSQTLLASNYKENVKSMLDRKKFGYLVFEPTGPADADNLFDCITPYRIDKRQNGQRFNDGTKFYTLTAQDKHGILIEGYIRKLTPIECERLQTVPDNYTEGVSNSQRYKMLGNGWTAKVIKIFFDAL